MTTKDTQKIEKSYDSIVIKPLEKSRIEITGSIPTAIWEKYRPEAIKYINNSVSIDGFRKGMVPENVLITKVGESAILEEMAEMALSKAYVNIMIGEKIDAIGKPEILVTKLAPANPLEFKITTAIVPQFKLPDYKKISKAEVAKSTPDELKVVDSDIEEAILKIRKSRASHEGHDHEKMTPEEHDKAIEAAMPELTDDFVKSLGDFTDVPDFKNKLSTMIAEQKADSAKEKSRIRIADALADATTMEIPEIFIEGELNRTQAQFEADIERMGVKMEDYLKHAKKTPEEIRAEWRPHAEKKAKLQLILNEIAKAESISPAPEEVEEEVNHIVEHYTDADRERAQEYATTVLTNEKVFQFLEKAGK
ncbi:MAG TPA: trigger factor [Candidatus Paceibacterota bacterium]|jgi:FKBP-type peptidyl-prolyl cis-trans isomerase (trigger factor)|nr:trigger factor [Candidatus Paceibacterota bacterium]